MTNSQTGNKILKVLDEIKHDGISIEHKKTRLGLAYVFGDERYELTVIVNPEEWLGLDFQLANSKIWYPINTDLYKPNDPKNMNFFQKLKTT